MIIRGLSISFVVDVKKKLSSKPNVFLYQAEKLRYGSGCGHSDVPNTIEPLLTHILRQGDDSIAKVYSRPVVSYRSPLSSPFNPSSC